MVAGVCLSVCRLPRSNSRTERPRKPKIGRIEAHHMGNSRTYLKVKGPKVKVTRPINAVTDNLSLTHRAKPSVTAVVFNALVSLRCPFLWQIKALQFS